MTIQDPPRYAELDRLPPEEEDDDWGPDWDLYPCDSCGYCNPEDCLCDPTVYAVPDEREGGSLAEERLEWEERT